MPLATLLNTTFEAGSVGAEYTGEGQTGSGVWAASEALGGVIANASAPDTGKGKVLHVDGSVGTLGGRIYETFTLANAVTKGLLDVAFEAMRADHSGGENAYFLLRNATTECGGLYFNNNYHLRITAAGPVQKDLYTEAGHATLTASEYVAGTYHTIRYRVPLDWSYYEAWFDDEQLGVDDGGLWNPELPWYNAPTQITDLYFAVSKTALRIHVYLNDIEFTREMPIPRSYWLLKQLLPEGAYVDDEDSRQAAELMAAGYALDDAWDEVENIYENLFPDAASEYLRDWEKIYGLPDGSAMDDADRQDQIIAHRTAQPDLKNTSIAAAMAPLLGYTPDIYEHPSWGAVGDQYWTTNVVLTGAEKAGFDYEVAMAFLRKIKPGHSGARMGLLGFRCDAELTDRDYLDR